MVFFFQYTIGNSLFHGRTLIGLSLDIVNGHNSLHPEVTYCRYVVINKDTADIINSKLDEKDQVETRKFVHKYDEMPMVVD